MELTKNRYTIVFDRRTHLVIDRFAPLSSLTDIMVYTWWYPLANAFLIKPCTCCDGKEHLVRYVSISHSGHNIFACLRYSPIEHIKVLWEHDKINIMSLSTRMAILQLRIEEHLNLTVFKCDYCEITEVAGRNCCQECATYHLDYVMIYEGLKMFVGPDVTKCIFGLFAHMIDVNEK